jgi:carotenoid cleavage dioxygenase
MAQPQPAHPNLVGAFAPLQMECDAFDLVIEGEIPRDLCGTFYRNGPNPQFAPVGGHHWFAGDGMLHAFHIENGKVSYKNRWARTKKWLMEHEAGRSLFSPLNPMDQDPSVAGIETDGIANTNVVWHGDKLLALEEGHAPFELDPKTLASRGAWKFDDKLVGPMTAHPKVDPVTGEMVFFAYSADGMLSNKMSYHVVNKHGVLTDSQFFEAPYASMVHDFMVTKDYVLFPIMPLTGSLDRAMTGLPAYAWEPEKGTFVGVMPRAGKVEDIRWFQGEPGYVFHPMNSFNQGEVITCDVSEYEVAPLFPNADGSPTNAKDTTAKLTRWTFDLSANTDDYKTEQLDDMACEFGRLDERFACHDYRHGYMLCEGENTGEGAQLSAIASVDHATGNRARYDFGPSMSTGEAIFVHKNEQSPEGEGYLMANVYDANTDKSQLAILDAQNISAGPIARAFLDHRVPLGFHGNWRPGGF